MSKKKTAAVIIFAVLLVLLAGAALILRDRTEFDRLKSQREAVVEKIQDKTVTVKENGIVTLPEGMKKLSDSGECKIVEFRGGTAVYFYTFRGWLGSSRGYLYVTDAISYEDYIDTDRYVAGEDFVNVAELGGGWYSCATE